MTQSNIKYKVGGIHTVTDGSFKILEIIPTKKGVAGRSNRRAVIRFLDTGFTTNIQLSNIKANKVKDKRLPSVYGVGYLDTTIRIPSRASGSIIRRVYDLWANMLKRVYGTKHTSDYKYYKDVTVDKRWHSFKHFLGTIHKVPGFDAWVCNPSMHLDKDLKGGRIYDVDNCTFLSCADNARLACSKRYNTFNECVVKING